MKMICAPMATLGHPAFRMLLERFGGCDEYYTEMINAGSLVHGGQFEKYYINPAPTPEKIVWQITGKDAERMAEAAAIVARIGGIGVDLNMGCCAPDIVKTGAGIAWMLKPQEETRAMVRNVRRTLDAEPDGAAKRLSVKLRLGSDDFTEESFLSFCDMLADEGVSVITLHPRTKKEKYRRPARWEYVEHLALRMANRTGVSVYLNGDIDGPDALERALAAAPHCTGVMAGRAAAQKPWLFAELRAAFEKRTAVSVQPGSAGAQETALGADTVVPARCAAEPADTGHMLRIDMLEMALSFIDALECYQPPEFWKTRAQRFFAYYCLNFSFAHYAQTQMLNAADLDDSRRRIADYFRRVPEDQFREIVL